MCGAAGPRAALVPRRRALALREHGSRSSASDPLRLRGLIAGILLAIWLSRLTGLVWLGLSSLKEREGVDTAEAGRRPLKGTLAE